MRVSATCPIRQGKDPTIQNRQSGRAGELAALRRSDLNLDECAVRVVRNTAQMNDGRLIEQEPKSRAGRRAVAFPREIAAELRWYLECLGEPGNEGLDFVGPRGGRLRR